MIDMHIKAIRQAAALLAVLLLSANLQAADARPVRWADLQPDAPALRSRLSSFDKAQKARLMRAIEQQQLNDWLREGRVKPPDLTARDTQLLQENLKDLMPLVSQVNAFEKKRNEEMVSALNGQGIELDGYLLPLKQSGKKITEFLLVPVVGACIHVPPPPANQMVVVAYPQGYVVSNDLFAPVTITGKLQLKSSKANLYLVDGSSDINVGYSMVADSVREMKKP